MNRRHEPLDHDERALAQLLAAGDDDMPSPEMDARILAAARAALAGRVDAPRPNTARRPRRRWPLALGLAASVTLAVGVAWQLRPPPLPVPAPAWLPAGSAAPSEAGPASPSPGRGEDAPAAPHDIGTMPTPVPVQAAPPHAAPQREEREERAVVAADRQRSAQRRVQDARQAQAQAQAHAQGQAKVQSRIQARAASAEAPPPVAAPAPMAAPMADTFQVAPALSPPAPPVLDPVALEDDAQLPATQWLQRIRNRQQHGQNELARASLARFIRDHPEQSIPEDLRSLLP